MDSLSRLRDDRRECTAEGWGEGDQHTLQHDLHAQQHIVIPEPEHAIAAAPKKFAASFVVGALLDVLAAVELDDQCIFDANEVHDEGADGVLTSEFRTGQAAVADVEPEAGFRVGL
ncbi:hypothetical protein N789_03560 [Arenimonas oryziterrae DSM 21050 = YC6267]|uniref:Uncharacterized protein n=1 Tax=Arenimonas oryziterrae DSM 21050 = YC6267 TaxID=1121015 RepID=A0A091B076_9GAMM|nr:hypothetical protein N789_03560 [Arenimonas oryziterrae DSM 21050 = YC6267]